MHFAKRNAVTASRQRFNYYYTVTLLAVILCCATTSSMTEAKPVVKRSTAATTIENKINATRLVNPCGHVTTVAPNQAECNRIDININSANTSVVALHSTVSSVCVNTVFESLQVPELISSHPRNEKLRALYNSLVNHTAYLEAISNSDTQQSRIRLLKNSTTNLLGLMCTMQCHLSLSQSDRQSAVDQAKQTLFYDNLGSPALEQHTCSVTKNITQLIRLINENWT